MNFEKSYFHSIYTIPADKGINYAIKATSTMPLYVINNLMVWYLIDQDRETETDSVERTPAQIIPKNAFKLMMNKSSAKSFLSKIESKNAKHHVLYNDIINISIAADMKFKSQDLAHAKKLIIAITNCLWHIDLNEQKIISASSSGKCTNLPNFFRTNFYKRISSI